MVNTPQIPQLRPIDAAVRQPMPGSLLYQQAGREGSPVFLCGHRGTSMRPALSEQDLLEIAPYGERSAQPGDVIVFVPPDRELLVVHRVVSVDSDGICTRGDNAAREDAWLVLPTDVIGCVVAAWRGARRRRVAGGRAGQRVACLNRGRIALDRALSRALRPLYHILSESSLARRLWPHRLHPRVVAFTVEGETSLRLLLGGRVVGRYDAIGRRWQIQRPFRLLVDEAVLPHVPGGKDPEV